jgi:hypothetical protein
LTYSTRRPHHQPSPAALGLDPRIARQHTVFAPEPRTVADGRLKACPEADLPLDPAAGHDDGGDSAHGLLS